MLRSIWHYWMKGIWPFAFLNLLRPIVYKLRLVDFVATELPSILQLGRTLTPSQEEHFEEPRITLMAEYILRGRGLFGIWIVT